MPLTGTRPALAVLVALVAIATGRVALPLPPDPTYAHAPSGQPEPIEARVRTIVFPTLGYPALVPYGGELDVLVRTGVSETDPARFKAWLWLGEGNRAARYEATVLSATRDRTRAITRLRVRIPARAPRECYDLEVAGPGIHDRQPNAVRVYGTARRQFRFAVLGDHQLWDPTWKTRVGDRNAGDYPRHGERELNRAIAKQELHEIALADPEFAVHVGDLLFGLDFPAEYADGWHFMRRARFAAFMLPGNHDGYATYGVRLEGTPVKVAQGLVGCQQHMTPPFDWPKAFTLLSCVFGDIRHHLFSDLRRDGLSHWRRTFGPPYFSWDYGDFHFVALNTYDGSAARRHSYALWVEAFDMRLGAPAVDNYGGQIGEAQLVWLEDDLKRASAAGKTIVVFGHHDPRGNLEEPAETRYVPNQPFPTSPLGLGAFQEWHYEGREWSSDGSGRVERLNAHSGTRLLALLARYASYYVSGHVHRDEHRIYGPGEELAPGIRARRTIEFVRVTTAAGLPRGPGDYWGYRLITADGPSLLTAPYDGGRGLLSVPAGNLWAEPKGETRVIVQSGLPRAARATLRFRLPRLREGWRFVDAWGHVEAPLLDVAPDSTGDKATYFVGVEVPPAPPTQGFPVKPGWQRKRLYEALPARGNRPPAVRVTARPLAGDSGTQPASEPAAGERTARAAAPGRSAAPGQSAVPGQAVVFLGEDATFSAEGTSDPDGDAIIAAFLVTPDGAEVRAAEPQAARARWRPTAVGRYRVRAEALDARGASGTAELEVAVVLPAPELQAAALAGRRGAAASGPAPVPPGARGCGCRAGGGAAERGVLAPALALLLALALLGPGRSRRAMMRAAGRVARK